MGLLKRFTNNAKAGLAYLRAQKQWEKDMENGYDPKVGLIKAGKAIGALAAFAALGAIALAVLQPGLLEAIFANAGVNTAYAGLIIMGLRGAATWYLNWRKHSPNGPAAGKDLKAGAIAGALLLMLAAPVHAEEKKPFNLFTYLTDHAFLAPGTLVTDVETRGVVEVRLVDDFRLADKWAGSARVGLFSFTRAGETAPTPHIPTSINDATNTYSDGEVWLSVRREVRRGIAIECIGGLTFKMLSITGKSADPLDGTKAAFGCGPRFSHGEYFVSVIPSHYGPVAESGRLLGPVPTLLVYGYAPLTFLGKNTAFAPDLAFGATKPSPTDTDTRRKFTRSLRLTVVTRF